MKTSHKRSLSSTLWLQRQLNDPYVKKAKEDGWRSRAAFKLIEIDEKHRLLKPGQVIVDLGSAPGGWCQYAAKKTGSAMGGSGRVIGIDLLPVEPIPGVTLAEMDFTDADAPDRLRTMLGVAAGERARRRRCPLRHGGQHDRPPQDGPSTHHRPHRDGDRSNSRWRC